MISLPLKYKGISRGSFGRVIGASLTRVDGYLTVEVDVEVTDQELAERISSRKHFAVFDGQGILNSKSVNVQEITQAVASFALICESPIDKSLCPLQEVLG